MKTRTYLILMVATILFPVVIFAGWGLELMVEEERETRISMVEAQARAIALDIDQEIALAEGALKVLAATDFIATADFESLHALMAKDKKPDAWTVLYDYSGEVLVTTHSPYGIRFPGIRYDWVGRAIDSNTVSVSNLRLGLISNAPVVSVNLPVRLPSGKKYLISRIYPPNRFIKALADSENPVSWIIGLFGTDGISIARNKNHNELAGKPVRQELFDASRRQSSGHLRHVTRENVAVYSVFRRTERTGWTVAIGVPDAEIEEPARFTAYYGALGLVSAFGVASLLVLFIGRRLTKGVDEAVSAAKLLGQGGIPDIRNTNVSEANILHSALHDAGVALLKESQVRLSLEKERRQLLINEKTGRRLAEDQNKAKDEFLAMLAHELRNPLAPIVAAADLLKISGINEKIIRHSSEVISRQVNHMTVLVDDLLDVSRVVRGLVELKKKDSDIKAVISYAVEQSKPLIESRGHVLNIQMPSAPAYVYGDETRLIQVIANLLNNAAKYTPQRGKIDLVLDIQNNDVKISVTDNGLGIDGSLLPHVFELFRQAERTPDRVQGGLGLGLALVKSIVSLHNGEVEAFSEGLGKGSTFVLTLPLFERQTGPKDSHDAVALEDRTTK